MGYPLKRIFASVVGALLLAGSAAVAQRGPTTSLDEGTIRAAIEQALGVAPRGFRALQSPEQAGVRLVDVQVERTADRSHRITIDLSQKALTYHPDGEVETITDHVLASTARLTSDAGHVEYQLLIEG